MIDDILPRIIQRTASDSFDHLGSFYDGYHDRPLEVLQESLQKSYSSFHSRTQCIIQKGTQDTHLTPLGLIGIDEQLRLSLLLKTTTTYGVAGVVHYPYRIDEYTRIFHYCYLHREEKLRNEDIHRRKQWFETTASDRNITHIITDISFGIDAVVILQLPADETLVAMIDITLEKYRAFLNEDHSQFKLSKEDLTSRANIIRTQVYSNVSELNKLTNFHDIFHRISWCKTDEMKYQPIGYILDLLPDCLYIPLSPTISAELEWYLYDLSTSNRIIERCFNEDMSNLLCGHYKEQLSTFYQEWSDVKKEYHFLVEDFFHLAIRVRCGQLTTDTLEEHLTKERQITFRTTIHQLAQNVSDLNEKGHLISDLNHQRIQYCNVSDRHIDQNDTEETMKRKLIIDENDDRVLCSSDLLNKINPVPLKEFCQRASEELASHSNVRVMYADFSSSSYPLRKAIVFPHDRENGEQSELNISTDLALSADSWKTATIEVTNILLLGEIGVGKSTFINALVNYLSFDTLEMAESNKPIVTIPLPTSDHSDERTTGQSITQRCKSYIYNIDSSKKKRLRIIDTPGFGDARGSDEDERTMKGILDFLKKLHYLNGICFLFKSNGTRINTFFQTCLIHLRELLGPNIRQNILFCFTNSRPTFYAPGSTAPLLREILSNSRISLKKQNIFCFDNESFRYLIVPQKRGSFNDLDREDYQKSWSHSVTQTDRLLRHIRRKLPVLYIEKQSRAQRRVQIDIVQLVHPMIEIIRGLLWDIINRKATSQKVPFQTHSNEDDDVCPRLSFQVSPIHSLQAYQVVNSPLTERQDNIINHLSFLVEMSAELGYFLLHATDYENEEPFLAGFRRLIIEEEDICQNRQRNSLNLQLLESLKKVARHHELHLQTIPSNAKSNTLTDIHRCTEYLCQYVLGFDSILDNYRTNIRRNTNQVTTI